MASKSKFIFKEAIGKLHGRVYDRLNNSSTVFLQKHGSNLPLWLTADAVTSGRLTLVFPTAILISRDYTILPATLVMVNAAFDYVDGAVARWEKNDKARALAQRIQRVTYSDVGIIKTKRDEALASSWGAYYDALADKAFAIPVWCCICAVNPEALWLQVAVLSHVAVESFSAYTRTKSYFLHPTVSSVVTANSTGKVKQMISMLGTALALVPATQLAGGVLLWASLPLSVASLADKLQTDDPPRALVVASELIAPHTMSALHKVKQSHDLIACLTSEGETKDAALVCSEVFDGVTILKEAVLDESEFDQLDAKIVYMSSDDDLSLIHEKLRARGVVRKL